MLKLALVVGLSFSSSAVAFWPRSGVVNQATPAPPVTASASNASSASVAGSSASVSAPQSGSIQSGSVLAFLRSGREVQLLGVGGVMLGLLRADGVLLLNAGFSSAEVMGVRVVAVDGSVREFTARLQGRELALEAGQDSAVMAVSTP